MTVYNNLAESQTGVAWWIVGPKWNTSWSGLDMLSPAITPEGCVAKLTFMQARVTESQLNTQNI